jgi:hypothetical protein
MTNMAEPARTRSSSVMIDDQHRSSKKKSASSLEGASLRVLQGGMRKHGRNNKTEIHRLSDAQLAMQLDEGRQNARRTSQSGGGFSEVSDSSLRERSSEEEDGGSVLDLGDGQGRSYTDFETSEGDEHKRQDEMNRTMKRFLATDTKESVKDDGIYQGGSQAGRYERQGSETEPLAESSRGEAQPSLTQDAMAQDMMGEQMMDKKEREDQKKIQTASQKHKEIEKIKRASVQFSALIEKLFGVASLWAAIPELIVLNIQMWNILLFHKKVSTAQNMALGALSLPIFDYDPEDPWSKSNLIIVGLTILLDIIIGLIVGIFIALIFFIVYWILEANSILIYIIETFLGLGITT